MRVTLLQTYGQATTNINKNAESTSKLSQEVSTGLKLNDASDDPMGWANAAQITQDLRETNTFGSNMDFAQGWTQATDSALGNVSDLLTSAKNTALSAGSSTSAEQTAANAAKITQDISSMLSLADSDYNGRKLFSGTNNPAGNASTYTLNAGTGTYQYNGDAGTVDVRTGKGSNQTMTVNVNGPQVFSFTNNGTSYNVFDVLTNLKTAIANGDTTGIDTAVGLLDSASTNVSAQQSTTGVRESDLSTKQSALSVLKTTKTTSLSDVQDADTASVYVQLQQKQIAYQASLQVVSMVKSLNLTNYLSA